MTFSRLVRSRTEHKTPPRYMSLRGGVLIERSRAGGWRQGHAPQRTVALASPLVCSVRRPVSANVFQSALAQFIRIVLAGFRKLDDLVCYHLPDIVVAVSNPEGDASLFERDT